MLYKFQLTSHYCQAEEVHRPADDRQPAGAYLQLHKPYKGVRPFTRRRCPDYYGHSLPEAHVPNCGKDPGGGRAQYSDNDPWGSNKYKQPQSLQVITSHTGSYCMGMLVTRSSRHSMWCMAPFC